MTLKLQSLTFMFFCVSCACVRVPVCVCVCVLDCAHSYCKSCISEWFKKKKQCPICRQKHKGAPRSVRVADSTIDVLVAQLLLPAAKAERLERTMRIDADQHDSDRKKLEKDQLKLAQLQRQVELNAMAVLPQLE